VCQDFFCACKPSELTHNKAKLYTLSVGGRQEKRADHLTSKVKAIKMNVPALHTLAVSWT